MSFDRISGAIIIIICWKYADRKPLWLAIIRSESINGNEKDQNEKISIKRNEYRDER